MEEEASVLLVCGTCVAIVNFTFQWVFQRDTLQNKGRHKQRTKGRDLTSVQSQV